MKFWVVLLVVTSCGLLGGGGAAAQTWKAGVNYFPVEVPQSSGLPAGKVEVTEAFSYACPACNDFQPLMAELKKSLPPDAVLDYLPVSFNPSEDFPMFQLAYCTAQDLGIAAKTHDAMFDAVWKTGELATVDPRTHELKRAMPTLADAAAFYQRHAGVPVEKFLAASRSFPVDVKVRHDEELLKAYQVDRTPTLIVAGKYRLYAESAGGADQVIPLVKWLIAKDAQEMKKAKGTH